MYNLILHIKFSYPQLWKVGSIILSLNLLKVRLFKTLNGSSELYILFNCSVSLSSSPTLQLQHIIGLLNSLWMQYLFQYIFPIFWWIVTIRGLRLSEDHKFPREFKLRTDNSLFLPLNQQILNCHFIGLLRPWKI